MLEINEKIIKALEESKPIVALESTIISHGMPFPKNYETALLCEQAVIDNGAVPATIAIIDGIIKVGLTHEEIEYIAKNPDKVMKVSRRDIPYVVSKGICGATTVSATMICAAMAGIKVFATGGIGGVHRGGENSFDISADLEELGRTNVCVVCAGAKAILDLGLTLEYLETKGVAVLGYKTKVLPAFYSHDSAFNVDFQMDSPKEIADFLKAKWRLGINGGVLVTNPVDVLYEVPHSVIDAMIDKAIAKMNSLGIKGKEQTPFLLKEIAEISGNESLETNIKLVLSNCALAAKIAGEYYD